MGEAARLRAWGDGKYSARMRELPCSICGRHPVEAHHVKSRGAGGAESDLVPLCTEHHRAWHDLGRVTFSTRYHVNLDALAEALWSFRDQSFDSWRALAWPGAEATA